MSTVHAVIVFMSVSCALTDQHLWDDKVYNWTPLSLSTGAMTLSYSVVDTVIMTVYGDAFFDSGYFFMHHICVLIALGFAVFGKIVQWFSMVRIVAEMSNPFMNLWWMYRTAEATSSPSYPYVAGGFFMSFLVSRIIPMPFYYYHAALQPYSRAMLVMWTLSPILDLLNIYWFWRICIGLYKLITVGPSKDRKEVLTKSI